MRAGILVLVFSAQPHNPPPSLEACPPPTWMARSLEQGGSKGSRPIHVPGCVPLLLSLPPRLVTAGRSWSGWHPLPPPRPFGLDTTLGEILKTGKMEGGPGLGVHEHLAVVEGGKGWWSWKVGERSVGDGGLVLTVCLECPPTPWCSREIHRHLAERRR